MKKVMIVEKPSMKRKMEAAIKDNDLVVTASVGHIESLVDLEYFFKDKFNGKRKVLWRKLLEMLPYIPSEFPHTVTNHKVYREIEKALASADEIILGADPDREGELIHRNILEIAKKNGKVKTDKITRIWLHSETRPEIRRAWENRKNFKEYDGYYKAALIREIVDWLIGIQLTILYSVKYGKPGKPVSIGRVQTWLLAEIIRRYNEHQAFVPEDFWTFHFTTADGVKFDLVGKDEKIARIKDAKEADAILERIQGEQLIVNDVETKSFVEFAPALYDLKALQKEAASRYHIPPDATLKIAQSLYEKYELISYPRTDCNVLSPEEAQELSHAVALVELFGDRYRGMINGVKKFNPSFSLHKKYIGPLDGHYAIIPVLTYDRPSVPSLSSSEQKIFDLIVRRFLAVLLPPAKGETTTIRASVKEYPFLVKFKNYLDLGYRAFLAGKEGENEDSAPISVNYKSGDRLNGVFERKHDKTKPPKLYRDASVLSLMERAHLLIKDPALKTALKEANGIGTAATRASYVPLLMKRGYIEKNRDGTFVPTQLGRGIYKLLPEELVIPDFSAKLEYDLVAFVKGKEHRSFEQILQETEQFLKKVFTRINGTATVAADGKKIQGKCPSCGGDIVFQGMVARCEKEDCHFALYRIYSGAELTDEDIRQLLEEGETRRFIEMTSKFGRPFKAKLRFNCKKCRIEYVFEEREKSAPDPNRPLSPKQQAVVKKNAPEEIIQSMKEEKWAECRQWLDTFFAELHANKKTTRKSKKK